MSIFDVSTYNYICDTDTVLDGFIDRLKDHGYKIAACSWCRGYVSRKIAGEIEKYNGRYGTGYKIHTPTTSTTRYHLVTYYIK